MATLHLLKNPLSPKSIEQHCLEPGTRVIDWLVENYPDGCGGVVRFYLNGEEKPLDDADYAVQPDDYVALTVNPAIPAAILTPFLISLAVSVVMAAASIALTLLLRKPDAPVFSRPTHAEPSPVYSVRSNQNTARLGEPVPVVYGQVLHTPDIAAQPYVFHQGENDEYLDMLLCLGHGHLRIDDVLIGDTPVASLADAVQYHVIAPDDHDETIGVNRPSWSPAFYENMVTAPEVGEQQFTESHSEGWFRLGKGGQQGTQIFCNISFPQGIYQTMDAGDITSTQVSGTVTLWETDAIGNFLFHPPVGTDPALPKQYVFAWNITTWNRGGGGSDQWSRNPRRVTLSFTAPRVAYWSILMTRNTNAEPNGGEINRMVWTSASMVVANNPASVYGQTTLMAVRLKATSLGNDSERSIKVRCTRWLNAAGNGTYAPTLNPADAFYDILMNQQYGGRRPISEIDSARVNALRSYWAPAAPDNHYFFNAVYTGKTTVWEALMQCLVPFGAAPLPLGGYMSVMQDGVKTARTMLFTEQNIVRDSFKLLYSFDDTGAPDGIEIEYRDPVTWTPAYVIEPDDAVDPEKIELFGCTDARHAAEFALLQWNRRNGNRRAVSFETEMEGLIPGLGDHVAVQHTLPRWGQSGFVVGVTDDRLHVTLDRKLRWSEIPGPYYMIFRDNRGGVSSRVSVTRDGADDKVVMSADPWSGLDTDWALTLQEELTHFAWGNASTLVKDFILTNIAPKGNGRVTIEGVYYEPSVYTGTLHFMQQEVPY